MRPIALAVAFGLGVVAGCGYSPSPASGTLKCGPSASCPEGYSCTDGLTCWKNGQSPFDAGIGKDGHGSDAAAVDKFIGRWTFATGSTRVRTCTDGTNETKPWSDYFDVAAGVAGALATDYYCNWDLDLNATGTSTAIRAGEFCSAPDPMIAGTTYTWHGMTFTLTTADGSNGTLSASLPYDYQMTSGSGSCTMTFTGPVTKS